MATVNVIAADTDKEARRLFTSQQQAFVNLRRGMPGLLPKPIDDIERYATPAERMGVDHALRYSFVSSPDTVEEGLREFMQRIQPDELMITSHIHNHAARLKSLEIAAEVRHRLSESTPDRIAS